MLEFAVLVLFPGLMIFSAVTDLLTLTIPNRVSVILCVSFFVIAYFSDLSLYDMAYHIAAGLLVLAACIVFFAFGWVGGGDGKLASSTALWVGFSPLLVEYLIVSALLGGILTLIVVGLRMSSLQKHFSKITWIAFLHEKHITVPYGIALSIGGLLIYPATEIWVFSFH